ncbi:hypothetical protein [Kitasatospora camelliae]|uniref:Uncharacterized protein n=1 Tax=Kitasatospora camelliae TaxID=3156397 RepID=A0AAU8JS09_9ACTN
MAAAHGTMGGMGHVHVEVLLGSDWVRAESMSRGTEPTATIMLEDVPDTDEDRRGLLLKVATFLAQYSYQPVWITVVDGYPVLFGPGAAGPFRLRPSQ